VLDQLSEIELAKTLLEIVATGSSELLSGSMSLGRPQRTESTARARAWAGRRPWGLDVVAAL